MISTLPNLYRAREVLAAHLQKANCSYILQENLAGHLAGILRDIFGPTK